MSKEFKRKDLHKKKRLPDKWRKPKGITNKMGLKRKGHRVKVSPGFGTKNSDKATHKSGLKIITITNKEQLKSVNSKLQGIIIGKTGKKKKLEIIEEAEKLKITILNFKIKEYKESAQKFIESKKKEAEEREKKKAAKQEAEKKAEKKKDEKKDDEKKEEPELSEEEKKKQEKEEKDKIITKGKQVQNENTKKIGGQNP